MSLRVGVRLGPYEVLAPLGAGGMGEVYRALDPRLGREVAIKVLPEPVAKDPERLRRFEKEARAVGALNHPNILTVHDVGSDDGSPFVVTELLEGETLREVLLRRAPTTHHVLSWAVQAAQGLSAAHQKGIVHRDIKPDNLFLTNDGRVKILDFGLAKLMEPAIRSASLTKASTATPASDVGVVLGTVAYMSPEQAAAEGVDHRSDIFSLGIVLYELLSGEHPFRRATVTATLTAILHETPLDLSVRQPGLSPAVDRIVIRCLEKRREDRFQSAHDLALVLEAVLEGGSAAAALRDVEERSPYPGLSSFTEEDAGRFFGREQEVEALWGRLRGRRLLAVIGPSGAGKTSFVRAGVVAGRPEGWAAIVATPGGAPLRGLGQALAPQLASDPEALRKLLTFEDSKTAFELLSRWRRNHEEALVIIDQFEELFTLNPAETQARFASLLGRLASEADVHVLLSLRDDFLMRCHTHEALGPVFEAIMPLGPMTGEALRRALVEPASKRGYRFEDDALVDEMVGAVEGARGALPLLAFAVSRLWERRKPEEKLLTRKAYREIGGVEGALARHAEETLERIGLGMEKTVRELFRNLTTGQGTRAALDREELLSALPDRAAAEEVLRQLIDARLLTSWEMEAAEGQPARHRVEIVHESLLTAWPRLVRWQTQDADGAQLRDQLRQAAHLWEDRGRAEDLLWTGTSYLDYQAWRARYPGKLSSLEEDFSGSMKVLADRTRRRRRAAGGAVLVALALGLGVVAMLWSRSEVQRAKAQREAQRANQEAEAARQVSGFLVGLFNVSDPGEAKGNSVSAREILDRGASKIDRELKHQPLVQARLMNTMGRVYESLGLYNQALPLLDSALATRRKLLGRQHLDVAESLDSLGSVRWHKGEYDAARALLEEALAMRERLLGPEAPLVADSLRSLGNLVWRRGQYDEAKRLLTRALVIGEKNARESPEVASTLQSLGAIAYRKGDFAEAGRIWERTLAIREKTLGPDHPLIAQTLNNLAIVHSWTNDSAGARPLLERAVRIQEKVLGPKHPDLASGLMNLGDVLVFLGDDTAAKPYYTRAVAILEEASPTNPELARFLDRLARVTLKQGDADGACRLYERSLALREKVLGPKHHEVAESLSGLANCARRQGRRKEAEALFERSFALNRRPDGGYYPGAVETLDGYVAVLRATGKKTRAAEMEALAATLRKQGTP